MNVLYIFDDNYADISGVSIYSLLNSNVDVEEITVYIIDGGISDINKTRLKNVVNMFNRNICFLPFSDPDEKFGIKLDVANWCKTNYIRIYLEELMPTELRRVLYIDSDTLIRGSLKELYNMEMKGKPIAAVYDCYPLPKYRLGFTRADEYFSDGVLLLDLECLRRINSFDSYQSFLKECDGRVAYLEQGAINYVMKNRIELMPSRYNVMTLSLVMKKCPNIFYEKDEPFYSELEMKTAIENPIIVHFTGHLLYARPWQEKSNHPYRKEWVYNLSKTPWFSDFKYRKINKKPKFIYFCGVYVINLFMRISFISKLVAINSPRMKEIREHREN